MSKKLSMNPVQHERHLAHRMMRRWARNIQSLSQELMKNLDTAEVESVLHNDVEALQKAVWYYDKAITRYERIDANLQVKDSELWEEAFIIGEEAAKEIVYERLFNPSRKKVSEIPSYY